MNKILSAIFSPIAHLIDNMPMRTVTSIKQSFYMIIIIGVLAGVTIGIIKGKNAAKISGMNLVETANDTFEFDQNFERKSPHFNSMIESDGLSERETGDFPKQDFPANERLNPASRDFVVEADRDRKNSFGFADTIKRDSTADVNRLDTRKVESEVSRVERNNTVSDMKPQVIQKDRPEALPEPKTRSTEKTLPYKGKNSSSPEQIKPLSNTDRVIE